MSSIISVNENADGATPHILHEATRKAHVIFGIRGE